MQIFWLPDMDSGIRSHTNCQFKGNFEILRQKGLKLEALARKEKEI